MTDPDTSISLDEHPTTTADKFQHQQQQQLSSLLQTAHEWSGADLRWWYSNNCYERWIGSWQWILQLLSAANTINKSIDSQIKAGFGLTANK